MEMFRDFGKQNGSRTRKKKGGVSKQAKEPHTSEDMSHNELLEVSSLRENTEGHFKCLDAGVTRDTRQNLFNVSAERTLENIYAY